jgi:hypothetical protein
MNHEVLSEANLNAGTEAKRRSPKVNPDLEIPGWRGLEVRAPIFQSFKDLFL